MISLFTIVWSQCFNITAGLATVDDVCVSLLKGSDCGVTMKLTIAGLLVKEEVRLTICCLVSMRAVE